jgi:hypothetical protein
MIDRLLRLLDKVIFTVVCALFVYLVYSRIAFLGYFGEQRAAVQSRAQSLATFAEENSLAVPPKDSAQVSGKVLGLWNNVPPGGELHGYDFYPPATSPIPSPFSRPFGPGKGKR